MKNIVIVVGSARPGRVADKVLRYVQDTVAARDDIRVTIADLKELDLPFFDAEYSPADPRFTTTNQAVQNWTKLIAQADGVLLLTAEYNHQLTAIMKNAIDWIYAEWSDKPVATVSYGWGGGILAVEQLEKLLTKVEARYVGTPTSLYFNKNIEINGDAITAEDNTTAINATLTTLTT